jgi:hypothetical protein
VLVVVVGMNEGKGRRSWGEREGEVGIEPAYTCTWLELMHRDNGSTDSSSLVNGNRDIDAVLKLDLDFEKINRTSLQHPHSSISRSSSRISQSPTGLRTKEINEGRVHYQSSLLTRLNQNHQFQKKHQSLNFRSHRIKTKRMHSEYMQLRCM